MILLPYSGLFSRDFDQVLPLTERRRNRKYEQKYVYKDVTVVESVTVNGGVSRDFRVMLLPLRAGPTS